MIVTGIEEMTKSRSRVFLDGEFAFVLYKGELRRYHVKCGEELSKTDEELILSEILPKRARRRAMNLLLKKDYTTAKLREKLREGGYPERVVENALDYVSAFHYTDDLRYALDYILCHQEDRSKRRIEQDLKGKGVPQDIVEKAWEQWEQDGGEQDELGMIKKLLRKRGYDSENASVAERQKEYAFLMRKGFSSENIRKAVFGQFDPWMD